MAAAGVYAAGYPAGQAMSFQGVDKRVEGRMRRMLRHTWLVVIAAVLASIGLGALAFHYANRPTTLIAAVGPPNSDDVRIIQAYAQHLARERATVRLRLAVKDSAVEAAAAIDRGEADIAVVRRDRTMPQAGQAVAILRKNVVVLAAPAPPEASKSKRGKKSAKEEKKIEKIEDLTGRRIAVIGRSGSNVNLLNIILKQYEIPPEKVQIVQLETTDVGQAIRDSKVDAIMSVGPIGSRITTDAVAAVTRDREPPTFLAIDASEAIAQRNPVYESTEIAAGAFGGAPQRPPEAVETIGFNHYIVARKTLDETTAGDVTRLLLTSRQALAAEIPSIGRIEAPETDKDAAVPVHPGAAAYIDGEQKTFFERYNDWIYYGLMLVSILGSAMAWLMNYAKSDDKGAEAKPWAGLERLLELMRTARTAPDLATLEQMQAEADEILQATMREVESGAVDQSKLQAFSLMLEQARLSIADRRSELRANGLHRDTIASASIAEPEVGSAQLP
jgi:TRAP transporter TAXI family solute receptor